MTTRLGAGLALALMAATAGACGPPGEAINPHAVRVIDGDTLALSDGRRIRLAGIDAPETGHRAACAAEAALAARATRALAALVTSGRPLTLHRPPGETRDLDRYGRQLRDLDVGGRDAGRTLVAQGLARPWRGWRASWCDGQP